MKLLTRTKTPRALFYIASALLIAVLSPINVVTTVSALDYGGSYDYNASNDNLFYDPNAGAACSTSSSSTNSGGVSTPSDTTSSTDDYSADQVRAFMHETITSTWNISDSTVEDWFLKQSSAQSAVSRFGLNSGNIGEITSVVKAAGVSPVFFYTYAVNEGPIWGFINHYSGGDIAGGGVANAKRDADYIVKTAASVGKFEPAWYDVDNPGYRGPPPDVQAAGNADFKSLPAGSIGIIYIPATAATTWEVYYPDALKGSVNGVQNYGAPLQGMMKSIKRMGGDPLAGGATVSPSSSSCSATNTVAGAGMTKAINFAVMIANNDGYGYDQGTRESGYVKWKSDPNCTSGCGSFDCSSLVSAALTEAGYFTTNPNFATSSEGDALEKAGFTRVFYSNTHSFATSEGLLPGDILVTPGSHTEIYMGNNQMVGAHIDENGNIAGGKTGDQTGNEISVGPYRNHPWESAWRAPK